MPPRKRILVAVVTGSRAEFGLLRPVMEAVQRHPRLRLAVIAGGAHLLPPARTIGEVEAFCRVAARVPMQRAGRTGRIEDASALGRGVSGFARGFGTIKPDWVVVLGDRIEAFAAASAASIGGIAVCHIHGGDRAEGVADEAMRHAITKLAHLHCAATSLSARRILRMGERPEFVHITGSPAIDGLERVPALSQAELGEWKDVCTIVLLHPSGQSVRHEAKWVQSVIAAVDQSAPGDILALAPNLDPGNEIIREFLKQRAAYPSNRVSNVRNRDGSSRLIVLKKSSEYARKQIGNRRWHYCEHLPREKFIGLLKSVVSTHYGLLVGNSSAGLIEATALGLYVINVGRRQAGREQLQTRWLENVGQPNVEALIDAVDNLMGFAELQRRPSFRETPPTHLYGDGRAGERIAGLLAEVDPRDPALLRKQNSY